MDYEAPRGAVWAAQVFTTTLDVIGDIVDKFRLLDWGTPAKPLDRCKTAKDVIAYANSIRNSDPSFSSELMAAANRSEE